MTRVAAFPAAPAGADQSWPLWPVLPLAPYGYRKTIVEEVVPGQVWAFDQLQGTLYVHVPVRMSVVKLSAGGLLCYCPVAPTTECIRELRLLEAEHGPVKHVVLPTLGVEHKAFIGPFCSQTPQAEVWYSPGQYTFPVNFPDLAFLGLGRAKPIPDGAAPWSDDLAHATLGPILPPGNGGFCETAFFHKASKTLLVVDALVSVPKAAPDIVAWDARSCLFHARDDVRQYVEPDAETLQRGWERLALFGFFFMPQALTVVESPKCFEEAKASPMKGAFGWADVYPFEWDDAAAKTSFDTLNRPKVLVAPILQELILNRNPTEVRRWLDVVCSWPFQRIVPCHLAKVVAAAPRDVRDAFDFLAVQESQFFAGDLAALRDGEAGLVASGEIFGRAEKPRPRSLLAKLAGGP
ncbi:hypothetical protein M885DRAFT_546766 [Pelagophyceae sp. CCMP2097]|nr:hypothetical protein M885DRAFT_546766 [Pelagophyceae sp. CCMP2097]